eukprot:g4159.t1
MALRFKTVLATDSTTSRDVCHQISQKLGFRRPRAAARRFALFEVDEAGTGEGIGGDDGGSAVGRLPLERALSDDDLVVAAQQRSGKLLYRVRLFLRPIVDPKMTQLEYLQAVRDVISGRIPLTDIQLCSLAALQAQETFGTVRIKRAAEAVRAAAAAAGGPHTVRDTGGGGGRGSTPSPNENLHHQGHYSNYGDGEDGPPGGGGGRGPLASKQQQQQQQQQRGGGGHKAGASLVASGLERLLPAAALARQSAAEWEADIIAEWEAMRREDPLILEQPRVAYLQLMRETDIYGCALFRGFGASSASASSSSQGGASAPVSESSQQQQQQQRGPAMLLGIKYRLVLLLHPETKVVLKSVGLDSVSRFWARGEQLYVEADTHSGRKWRLEMNTAQREALAAVRLLQAYMDAAQDDLMGNASSSSSSSSSSSAAVSAFASGGSPVRRPLNYRTQQQQQQQQQQQRGPSSGSRSPQSSAITSGVAGRRALLSSSSSSSSASDSRLALAQNHDEVELDADFDAAPPPMPPPVIDRGVGALPATNGSGARGSHGSSGSHGSAGSGGSSSRPEGVRASVARSYDDDAAEGDDDGGDAAEEIRCRVILLGDSGVGKTALLARLVDGGMSAAGGHQRAPKVTIGVEFSEKVMRLESGRRVRARIWDTAGQERYRSITKSHYRRAEVAVLVYDITSAESFRSVGDWLAELRDVVGDDVQLLLVGNKADLAEYREVPPE